MTGKLRKVGLQSPTGGHVAIGALDDKKGLGYGVTDPRFHLPRSANSSYPYFEDDEMPDVDVDDATLSAVNKKSLKYKPVDSLAAKSVDPFYFASGNTKLADCIWHTDRVIEEVNAFGDSMFPVPQLTKKKGPSQSGFTSAFPFQGGGGTSYRRTGTLRGWSKSPPLSKVAAEIEGEELEDEPYIYSLMDLAKKGYLEETFWISGR